ncbi:MAG TPA: tRNA preQ1(34) S-adenosylmethionine ribosyltransferase-isomerase QueA [Pyrinomonadaceae bacterium]|nr:tRNA preQ1(34) S-adenosylmethionine ribosyltransferase-isomerase QueA [Pyrinomonadaceae bacterium]
MLISEFDYELPEELIAQAPLAERDASRMLVLDRARSVWRDSAFAELPAELREGDQLVVNNTRVFPARLVGRREPSGGAVELFLVEERAPCVWDALARPARRLARGQALTFGDGRLRAEVIDAGDEGRRTVRFDCDAADFNALLEEFGRVPLPPYIKRPHATNTSADDDADDAQQAAVDRERYQTVYAERRGAIAAPTAGLHFTPRVLETLRASGVGITEITLHVGYGTFAPVRAEDLSQHTVAPEHYEITEEAAEALNEARARGRRLVAVGTTTVRALESSVDERGRLTPGARRATLTITPGYSFKVVDALVTNFHLPRSSLLVLVAAFAGRELTLAAYRHAVAARYRFYSYGDCMLIL